MPDRDDQMVGPNGGGVGDATIARKNSNAVVNVELLVLKVDVNRKAIVIVAHYTDYKHVKKSNGNSQTFR